MSDSITKRLVRVAAAIASVGLLFAGSASADIPKELYEALGVSKSASPKELYDAVSKRYYDPEQGHGKGKYAEYWDPIPMSKYFDPASFYTPPSSPNKIATREDCIDCHKDDTRGWVHAWKKSVHANLDEIRQLDKDDPRAYKKRLIKDVEKNLQSMGKLKKGEQLKEVGCIDCHVDVGAEKGHHKEDLRMPDAAVCGTCHLAEFAERESERDTLTWPQDQWPAGRPSHVLDYQANVELATYAAMEDREIADGCTACHFNQNRCDMCHTRHQFSSVEARKPEACAYCHNGADHNEFENYMFSKHGTVYRTLGDTWNWDMPLKDAIGKNEQTAPTCAFCHMEYEGRFGHNVVRKVRWAFNPQVAISENLDHPWFEARLDSWVKTCTNCHSERYARAFLDMMDNGTRSGIKKVEEAREVIEKLYEDGLLTGQKTNRPHPPKPEHDGPGEFFQLFIAKGNNPSDVDMQFSRMWENDVIKLYKGLAHVNPGGWTYTEGWTNLLERYARIMDGDTRIREMASLKTKIAQLEEIGATQNAGLPELNSRVKQAFVGGTGTLLMLAGVVVWRRQRKIEG
jgi:hydroxylamine dehydrogenase